MTIATQHKVLATLSSTITPAGTPWIDIVDAVNKSGVKVKNWLDVRGIIQFMLDSHMIRRTTDLNTETYVSLKSA